MNLINQRITFLILLITVYSNVSSQNFEGTIRMKAENFETSEKSDIIWIMKGDKHKMMYTIQSDKGQIELSFYMNANSTQITMVSGSTKQEINISSLAGSPYMENIMVILPQNESKDIAGFSSKKFLAKGNSSSITLYVNESQTMHLPSIFFSKGILKALNENNIKGMPMLIEAYDLQGNLKITQEILSIISQSIEESEVSAP